ncbi:hypothetical protein Pan241w_35700 [Gimesia alba]|uniref:Replication-relaxation n=1 Tax=Gimesia alba TaxID=2527973 RepID=A0A517RHW9_9PLAN|nr:replication-relaxation family protein [Gimesia alba]QDT43469.1 hypothetical protein Pan241w_35700 [Gimesia alba]
MTSNPSYQPTPRDTELLRVIELLSPTAEQIFQWSQTFEKPITPFSDIGDLRTRLKKLHAAGLVRRWRLAIESQGVAPYYYKLSLEGHRTLYGKGAKPKRSRSFSAIGLSLHTHTKALADFIVHTKVAAHRVGASLTDAYSENEYCISVDEESLKFDGRFTLLKSDVRRAYQVELDCSTESNLSAQSTDSIARKIRILDAYDAQFEDARDPQRAITLFVCNRSPERVRHILETARNLVRNPNRSLIYGIYLPDYLATADSLTTACFLNHREEPVALWPEKVSQATTHDVRTLSSASVM